MPFAPSTMTLTSAAFDNGGAIPKRHTQEADDISPALSWRNPPDGTKAFAIVCHDPDAPLVSANGTYGYVHWVLYNIPASVSELAEGSDKHTAGTNDTGTQAYSGPMPPEGHGVHHYYFWVLALDSDKTFDAGLTLWDFLAQAEPHILGMNRLLGTYERR
ncbi:YbhB/YbcL family Raf kinase inhibitor-like protein [Marinimicrobium alkaliphilum]|uniref:YbhB/YbcL family Raf kinase inhibitor-like protein n=1 Tax=Marinimicrobium alkaliphilum TaxID=2202654 RepID=UPI000DB97C11|nr:YbhB/YbcL family Raf kinase inhibitor-like protein [Marinimicrobium alkaliphilum]